MNRSIRRVVPALLVAVGLAAATTHAQAPAGGKAEGGPQVRLRRRRRCRPTR
jgi:hypothetical protein